MHAKRGKLWINNASHRHLQPKVRIGKAGEGDHHQDPRSPHVFSISLLSETSLRVLIFRTYFYTYPVVRCINITPPSSDCYAAAALSHDQHPFFGPLRRPATPPATPLAARNASISKPRLLCLHPQGDDIGSNAIQTSNFHFTIQSATTRTRDGPLSL